MIYLFTTCVLHESRKFAIHSTYSLRNWSHHLETVNSELWELFSIEMRLSVMHFFTGLQANHTRRLLKHNTISYNDSTTLKSMSEYPLHSVQQRSMWIDRKKIPYSKQPRLHSRTDKCFVCDLVRYPRSKCPPRDAICSNCGKRRWLRILYVKIIHSE